MTLSANLREKAGKLSKWPDFPEQVDLMRRAADELDKRAEKIRRMQHRIDAMNGATCTE